MGWTRRDFAETFQRMLRDRYAEIGGEVKRLRETLGYSQEDLAYLAKVSVKTVSRVESPGDDPHETRGSTFRKLAAALGVTVEHLRAPLARGAQISDGERVAEELEDAAEKAEQEQLGSEASDDGTRKKRAG